VAVETGEEVAELSGVSQVEVPAVPDDVRAVPRRLKRNREIGRHRPPNPCPSEPLVSTSESRWHSHLSSANERREVPGQKVNWGHELIPCSTSAHARHTAEPLPDGDGFVLIASNFGRPHNPAWYHNLRTHPRAATEIDGVAREVEAHELSGTERDQVFQWCAEKYPPFLRYRAWAGNRRIPVLRLDPAS
jgi:deazaflavin-dependent oxidoreductase (nitroreductase family)